MTAAKGVTGSFPSFPPEIWRVVISSASDVSEPMDNRHDGTKPLKDRFHLAKQTTSESTVYVLMFVSKSFNALSTQFFLEKIYVRGPTQLSLLSHSLRQSPNFASKWAKWTRRFDFNYRKPTQDIYYEVELEECLTHVLRSCQNLTHLVLEASIVTELNGEAIVRECTESCRNLEVLHWSLHCSVQRSTFASVFRCLKVLRLEPMTQFTCPSFSVNHIGLEEFPYLTTVEGGDDVFLAFKHVALPSLSDVYIRNDGPEDIHPTSCGKVMFANVHGEKIKSATIVGSNYPYPVTNLALFLLGCTNLQELVMDRTDFLRVLSTDRFILPHVTRLGLTSYRRFLMVASDQLESLEHLTSNFPTLKLLRWFGEVDFPSSNLGNMPRSERFSDSNSGIRLENRDGTRLEFGWLRWRNLGT
ncbi:hypothetical protein BD410DRAFT_382421 [Rickenella mellea]|uniref:F-box domain-containing protein n=1 Tax=Rickenella mellea TaxID=50990 RepID=A0A4Y7PYC1_9AGAM|nr:hypothetical protein BD410DRAFT_382421 [Rickenella mellea]